MRAHKQVLWKGLTCAFILDRRKRSAIPCWRKLFEGPMQNVALFGVCSAKSEQHASWSPGSDLTLRLANMYSVCGETDGDLMMHQIKDPLLKAG